MAVYTDISEDELRAFVAAYDVGDLTSYKGIAEGVENTNYLLHTSQAAFILTLYEKRVNASDLPFFIGLMQHLASAGINCPLPVERRDGETLGHLAGRPAAMVTFLEGMWPRRPTAAHCRQLGTTMAQMHLAGADFTMQRRNGLGVDDWRPLWERCKASSGAREVLGPQTASQVGTILDRLEHQWPRDLPTGVIHADLFPDNVFFLDDTLSGVIDFYFACTDALAYDLAVSLNAWCFDADGSFREEMGAALLSGYQQVRPLDEAERTALPVLALGASLRFMLTRLYDWANTPAGATVVKKDPMEYVHKMRFHEAVTDAGAYGLKLP